MDAHVNNGGLEYNVSPPLLRFTRMTERKKVNLLRMSACLLLTGGVLLTGRVALADVTVNIIGEIVIPPCVVNNGNPIEVDFEDISIIDVSNARYEKILSVPVACTYYQGAAYVKVTGTMLSGAAGSNVLATNISNFGIALYQGSGTVTPLRLGDGATGLGYAITNGLTGGGTASENFTFTAKPYKQGSSVLGTGAFTASANMSISYQ